jgi:hypothetical protein
MHWQSRAEQRVGEESRQTAERERDRGEGEGKREGKREDAVSPRRGSKEVRT